MVLRYFPRSRQRKNICLLSLLSFKLLSFSFFLLQQDIFLCYRLEDPKVTTDDITWMDEIIKNYGFKKHPVADMWTEQPSFEGRLGTENFKTAAEKAEQFFLKFNKKRGISPWELLQKVTKNQNYKLLKITAARYLLVTHILWLVSGKKLTACKEKRDNYTGIPQSWKKRVECVFLNHMAAPLTNQTTTSGLLEKILELSLRNLIVIFKQPLSYHRSLYLTQMFTPTLWSLPCPQCFPIFPPHLLPVFANLSKWGGTKCKNWPVLITRSSSTTKVPLR